MSQARGCIFMLIIEVVVPYPRCKGLPWSKQQSRAPGLQESEAPSPGLSAKLTPSPPGKSTMWLLHFGKHETELLRDAGLWSCWGSLSALRPIYVLQGMP